LIAAVTIHNCHNSSFPLYSHFNISQNFQLMTLFTATLATAGVLLLVGMLLLWNSPAVQKFALGWPRSRRAAIILIGIAAA
jgi:hypothetical protein